MKQGFFWVASVVVRLALVAYGTWQDETMIVKYTDVDYNVFSDAAAFVDQGRSPYERSTYRYTPLLSFLMLPNVRLHIIFGKLLFCAADVCVGIMLYVMLRRKAHAHPLFLTSLWLFNPLVINVSSRGNAESLICFLVVATLFFLQLDNIVLCSVAYGLAVHFKIFPVIYAFPILFYLGDSSRLSNGNVFYKLLRFFNRRQITFACLSFAVFALLTGLFYYLYGWTFLYESFLYHATRSDHRHNFSHSFYMLYLNSAASNPGFLQRSLSVLNFIPQVLALYAVGRKFYMNHLEVCLFLMTFIFVTFNKVCTMQYYAWYFALLPLAAPDIAMPLGTVARLAIMWALAQGLWLLEAYMLEFLGINTFFRLFLAGLAVFIVNCFVVCDTIAHIGPATNAGGGANVRDAQGGGGAGENSTSGDDITPLASRLVAREKRRRAAQKID